MDRRDFMPRRVRLRLLLRGLAKLIAVIALAGAAGVGLGIGLSELTGDSEQDTSTAGSNSSAEPSTTGETAARRTAPKTTAGSVEHARTTTTHTATPKRQRRPSAARVRVVSVVFHRESAPSARRRRRAVLAIHVRVVNRGRRAIANVAPVLVVGARRRVEPSAQDSTGSLLRLLRPGSTADGTLRFKTAGGLTDRLASRRRAQLRIAGKPVTLKVLIGRPVRSAQRTR
jgi:hypothetical protein